MSNLRIGYINRADAATLTASPAMTSAGPVTYLQNDARNDVCVATSTASQAIFLTWGGIAYGDITRLTLWRHNLAAADTIRLQLYSDTAWTTQVYDSTALAAYASGLFDNWGWGFYDFFFTATAGVKSAKITVAASAAAFQCSRLFLGPYTEAPFNPVYGLTVSPASNAKTNRSSGGSRRAMGLAKWREMAFDIFFKTEADRAAWYEIGRYCDIDKSFIVSVFPGVGGTVERDLAIYGTFDGKAPGSKLTGILLYDSQMKITEL